MSIRILLVKLCVYELSFPRWASLSFKIFIDLPRRFLVTLALLPTLLRWLSNDKKVILVPNLNKLRLKETKDKMRLLRKKKGYCTLAKSRGSPV